jgi:hypothetical protein
METFLAACLGIFLISISIFVIAAAIKLLRD